MTGQRYGQYSKPPNDWEKKFRRKQKKWDKLSLHWATAMRNSETFLTNHSLRLAYLPADNRTRANARVLATFATTWKPAYSIHNANSSKIVWEFFPKSTDYFSKSTDYYHKSTTEDTQGRTRHPIQGKLKKTFRTVSTTIRATAAIPPRLDDYLQPSAGCRKRLGKAKGFSLA